MIFNIRSNLIIILILVYLINFNNSESVYFDTTKECTEESPCSLNNKNNWIGNKLPINGDDIIIDYSQEPEKTTSTQPSIKRSNGIINSYLYGDKINLNIASISIIGIENQIYPQLTLNDVKIIVSNGNFQVSSSTINLISYGSLTIDNGNLDITEGSNFTLSQTSFLNIVNNSQINSDKSIKKIMVLNNSTISIDNTSAANFYSQLLLSSSSLLLSLSNNLNFYGGFYSFSTNTSSINNAVFYFTSYIKNIKITGQVQLDSESNALVSILDNLYISQSSTITINQNSIFVIGGQVNGDFGLANTSSIELIGGNLKITVPNFKIDNLIVSESNTGTIFYEVNIPSPKVSNNKQEEEEIFESLYSSSSSSSSSSSTTSNSYFVNTISPNIIISSNSDLVLYNVVIKSLIESKSGVGNSIPSFNFFGSVLLETISITSSNVVITPNSNVQFIKGGCLYSLNIYGNLTVSAPGILVHPYAINILDESANLIVDQASISAIVNITSGTLLSLGSNTINSIYMSGENSVLSLQYSNLYINKDLITDSASTINLTSKISFYNTPTISISSTLQLLSNLIINFQIPKDKSSRNGNFSIITFNNNNNNNTSDSSDNSNNDQNNSVINFSSIKVNDINNNVDNNSNNYSYSLSKNNNSLSLLFTFQNYKSKFPEWATILIVIGSVVCIITISIIIYTIRQKKKLQIEYEYTRF